MLIPRKFFARPSVEVAPDLLGSVLEHETADGLVAVELTEVEAYAGRSDPASHAYRGKTARNAVMFGPPGHAYVYFTYGMHFCVNVVCLGEEGSASAVLLRAGRVIAGEELACARRTRGTTAIAPRDLARGPARLTQALGVDKRYDGADATDPASSLRLLPGDVRRPPRRAVRRGPRVGVAGAGAARPWRFWLDGEPSVSTYRPAVSRRRAAPASGMLDPDG